ncbi:unnamed protein product [Rhizoctonia solani]|uniref:Tail specific protease domain-containing protein n=1 Tax=Rhizoctonia solani TaxID=456999 RepID=A0A8H3AFQ8_9AGAM|nr:unnamed protein product [Rhizoctonia solani]
MYYIFALATAALAAGSPLQPRQSDPCTAIATKGWYKPSQVLSCIQSFPYNETLRDNIVDVVSKTFNFHTSVSFHLNMPDPYTDDTVDLQGELRRIGRTKYDSDFNLHQDVSKTVKRLNDGHAGYINYCYDSLFVTYLPFPLAVLARPDALDVQNIHVVPEASTVAAAEFGSDAFNGARIVSINNKDPWAVVDQNAAVTGSYQAKTTRQNAFFSSYQRATSEWSYRLGDFAQWSLPVRGDSVTLRLVRNGTNTEETYTVPYLSRIGSSTVAFTNAKSLWANNCVATTDTNGAAYYNKAQAKTKVVAKTRFQPDPEIAPIINGRRQPISTLVADGPLFDVTLPSRLTPPTPIVGSGALQFYMLDDNKTAVLALGSFSGDFAGVQKGILDGINTVKSKGATRLLVDVTNNGGGYICLAAWLHRVLAGPGPGTEPQPGLDGSVRAQDLAQKITAKIVANNTGVDPDKQMLYNPLSWRDTKSKRFPANFNWLDPAIKMQINGVTDKFSQEIGDDCIPYDLTPPAVKPFEFDNIAILNNGRCASSCSLFTISMRTKYNVKTVVVGGKPGTTQQYCGIVGGQSLNFAAIDSDVKTAGLKNDPLAPPDFMGDNYQGITWKLGYAILDHNKFEEFMTHPAQFTFPLLPSTVNNPVALWKDITKRLWPN